MQRLAQRVCVVTGAGQGIGKAIAERFLAEGARVWLCDVVPDRLEAALAALAPRGEVGGGSADVSRREEVEAMFALALQRWGRVDVLVNNAGVWKPMPFLELTDPDWDRVLNVNLRGAFICSQLAARQMAQQGGGSIISIASTNGLRGQPAMADYGASKAGLINLMLTLAVELAPYGIRANTICPGTIFSTADESARETDPYWERMRRHIPLGRLGLPADIAAAAAYLASDDAAFVTGHTLVADGGLLAPQLRLRTEETD